MGDGLAVGHRNQQHPAFVWSATEDGHHGWVPEDYVEIEGRRDAVARRDYDSSHLTVVEGEVLEVLEQVETTFCVATRRRRGLGTGVVRRRDRGGA